MSVSTSGCAVVLLGNASPAMQTRYGFELSEADQYLVDSADFVRSLDPCGLFSVDDLAALGTLVQLRPDGDLSTCTADVQKPTASGRFSSTDSVSIDLHGHRPPTDDSDVHQVTIGGEQVYMDSSSSDSCYISFPLRDEFDGTAPSGLDDVRTELNRSFARITVYRQDACTAATRIAETALGRMGDPPLRAGSKYDLPLASKDPCSVLGSLPETWTVDRWRPDADPYSCHFTSSSATFEQMLTMIDVTLDHTDSESRSTDRDKVRQGGYTFETVAMDDFCSAETVVGNPVLGMPVPDDSYDYARTTPTLSVMTDDCDSALALAVAAADALTG